MKIPVTQELIDAVRHDDDACGGHFPCLTERALQAIVGWPVWMNTDGHAGSSDGHIDAAGIAYMRAYDAHDWDAIQPGEFEYVPNE